MVPVSTKRTKCEFFFFLPRPWDFFWSNYCKWTSWISTVANGRKYGTSLKWLWLLAFICFKSCIASNQACLTISGHCYPHLLSKYVMFLMTKIQFLFLLCNHASCNLEPISCNFFEVFVISDVPNISRFVLLGDYMCLCIKQKKLLVS